MQELISNIQTMLEVYRGTGKINLLLISFLGLLIIKTNQRTRIILYYMIIGSIIVLNPFLIQKEISLFGATNLYRMSMLLLIPILSAYAFTIFYKEISGTKQKTIVAVGIILMIAFSGRFVYTSNNFYHSNNEGKVYDLAVEISDFVTKSNDTPMVAISEAQGIFLRQYNPNIRLVCPPIHTENWIEEDENIRNMRAMLSDGLPDMETLTNLSRELECDFLVLMEDQVIEDSPEKYGFTYVDTFGLFQVFENRIGVN